MHRRDFLFTFGALAASVAPARAREEIASLAGELAQLTKPGNGDNRATYMPDGKSLRAFRRQRDRRLSDMALCGGRRQCTRHHRRRELATTVLES
ncbi:MAG TPA: hypothetical protein VHU22_14485 [Xanthobacteraceae bacterium]|jgi:hypothetical protein|nr:hypothetical protein [Xanthobacteraceae bacterium]